MLTDNLGKWMLLPAVFTNSSISPFKYPENSWRCGQSGRLPGVLAALTIKEQSAIVTPPLSEEAADVPRFFQPYFHYSAPRFRAQRVDTGDQSRLCGRCCSRPAGRPRYRA